MVNERIPAKICQAVLKRRKNTWNSVKNGSPIGGIIENLRAAKHSSSKSNHWKVGGSPGPKWSNSNTTGQIQQV